MRTHITIAIFVAAILLTLPSGSFSDQETEPSKEGKPSISISAGKLSGLYTYTSEQILGLMVEKGVIDGEILRDSMPNLRIAELPGIEDYEDELDDICDYLD